MQTSASALPQARQAAADDVEARAPLDLTPAQSRPGKRPGLTRMAVGIALVLVLAPIYFYYSRMLGLGSNSDAAINVLEGWDMVNGRPLLEGWIQGNNSWMTNELLIYALVAWILGPVPSVIYVSHGIIYSILIVVTGLLALGPIRDRRRTLLVCAVVGAMLIPVTYEVTAWMMLSVIDHLGTSIPLMVMLIILDRMKVSWKLGFVSFGALTWAMTSDHLALYIGVLPVVIVCGLRAYFQKENRKSHLAIAAGAIAAIPADLLFKTTVELLGGATRNNPPDAIFATAAEMSANLWETVHAVMIIFGSSLLGVAASDAKTEVLHLPILATACAAWIIAWRSIKKLALVDQILITAITVNLLAFMFSPMPGPYYTAHEILPVLPFSVALAARLIVPRLTTLRTRVPVYAGLALSIALLGLTFAARQPVPDPTIELTRTLQQNNLKYGLSGFWQAASVTVQSGKTVEIASILNDSHGNITPFWQVMRDDWYDPAQHDARFVVSDRQAGPGNEDLNAAILEKTFGPHQRLIAVGHFDIRVYDYNILTRLPAEKLPHQL